MQEAWEQQLPGSFGCNENDSRCPVKSYMVFRKQWNRRKGIQMVCPREQENIDSGELALSTLETACAALPVCLGGEQAPG